MTILKQIDNIIRGDLFNKLIAPNKLYIKSDLPSGLHKSHKFGVGSWMSQSFYGYFLITDKYYNYDSNDKEFQEITIPDDALVIVVDMYRIDPVVRDEVKIGHLFFVSDKIVIN